MYSAFVKRINQVSVERRSRLLGERLERVGRGDLILTSEFTQGGIHRQNLGYRTPSEACEEKNSGINACRKSKDHLNLTHTKNAVIDDRSKIRSESIDRSLGGLNNLSLGLALVIDWSCSLMPTDSPLNDVGGQENITEEKGSLVLNALDCLINCFVLKQRATRTNIES
ncbi:hypothetical protein SAMN05216332_1131 [Nitrosospira briensis]|nr:hypothetical protein SAMN05216332_1131 [Nitrosospira briensis]